MSRTSSVGDDSHSSIDFITSTSNIRNYMKNLLTRTDQIHNPDCNLSQGSNDKGKTIKSQHETTAVNPLLSEGDENINCTHDMNQSCNCPHIPLIPVDKQHSSVSEPNQKVNYYDDPGSLDESLSTIDTTFSCFDDSQDLSTMCDIYQEKINQVKSILNEMHPEFENLEVDQRQFSSQKSAQNNQNYHRGESKIGELHFCEQKKRPRTRRTWWVEEYDSDQGF